MKIKPESEIFSHGGGGGGGTLVTSLRNTAVAWNKYIYIYIFLRVRHMVKGNVIKTVTH